MFCKVFRSILIWIGCVWAIGTVAGAQEKMGLSAFPVGQEDGGMLGVGVKAYERTMEGWSAHEHELPPEWGGWGIADDYPTIINLVLYTAVKVGPKVVLTAAHNVWDAAAGKERELPDEFECCDVHPAWPANHTADYALCRLRSPEMLDTYEIINLSEDVEKTADALALTGYGGDCKKSPTTLIGSLTWMNNVEILEHPSDDNYYFKVDHCLCRGDSGGPGFYHPPGGYRLVLGINSKGSCNPPGQSKARLSSTRAAGPWMIDWAEGKAEGQTCGKDIQVDICGVNLFREDQNDAGLTKGLCGS